MTDWSFSLSWFYPATPPEDLVLNQDFMNAIEDAVKTLQKQSGDFSAGALITTPWRLDKMPSSHPGSHGVYNCALLIHQGQIIHQQAKIHLPNYAVFDEKTNL